MAEAPLSDIEASLPANDDSTPESRKRLANLIVAGGLSKVARLDCCVTMVDCTSFMGEFETTDFLTDRHGKQIGLEDEKLITDLYAQIALLSILTLPQHD